MEYRGHADHAFLNSVVELGFHEEKTENHSLNLKTRVWSSFL